MAFCKLETVLFLLTLFFSICSSQKSLRDVSSTGYFYEKPALDLEETVKGLEAIEEKVKEAEKEVVAEIEAEAQNSAISPHPEHTSNEYLTPIKDSFLMERAITNEKILSTSEQNLFRDGYQNGGYRNGIGRDV